VVVVDRMVNVVEPLDIVCGELVSSVVDVPEVRLNVVEKPPELVRLPKKSMTRTVAVDCELASFRIWFGEKAQEMPTAGPAVYVIVELTEETPVPSENVREQSVMVLSLVRTNVARPAFVLVPVLDVEPLAGKRPVQPLCVIVMATPWPVVPVTRRPFASFS
jgi:hypothetical protein